MKERWSRTPDGAALDDLQEDYNEALRANAVLATTLDLAARSIHLAQAEHHGPFEKCAIGFCNQRAEITEQWRL